MIGPFFTSVTAFAAAAAAVSAVVRVSATGFPVLPQPATNIPADAASMVRPKSRLDSRAKLPEAGRAGLQELQSLDLQVLQLLLKLSVSFDGFFMTFFYFT
jgi:hypothetical protein